MGYPVFEFSLGTSGLEMVGQTDDISSIRSRLSVVFFWLSFVLFVHYVPRDFSDYLHYPPLVLAPSGASITALSGILIFPGFILLIPIVFFFLFFSINARHSIFKFLVFF